MDIAIVGNNSIKLKGKQVAFVVNPTKDMPKISADAVLLLNGDANIDLARVTDYRIVLDGPGEYEVKKRSDDLTAVITEYAKNHPEMLLKALASLE